MVVSYLLGWVVSYLGKTHTKKKPWANWVLPPGHWVELDLEARIVPYFLGQTMLCRKIYCNSSTNNVSKEPNPTQLNSTPTNPQPLWSLEPKFPIKSSSSSFVHCHAWLGMSTPEPTNPGYFARSLLRCSRKKRCRKGGFSSINCQGKMVFNEKKGGSSKIGYMIH